MTMRKRMELSLSLVAVIVAACTALLRGEIAGVAAPEAPAPARTTMRTERRSVHASLPLRTPAARRVQPPAAPTTERALRRTASAQPTTAATAPAPAAAVAANAVARGAARTEASLAGIVGASDLDAALRGARRLAANAEVAADVRAAAEAWTGSDDGAVRARGLLVAALLDRGAGVARWHAAARGDRDAGVRAALLAHAPLTGRRAEDEGVLAALLDEIESSADAATRRAALEGLTVRLAAAEIERLALAAARETDAAVRQALVREVAGGGAATPRVIEFLAGAAFDAQGDDLTHGVARAGLEQLEARTPGALDAALMARLRAAAAALTAGPGSDAEVEG